MVLEYHNWGKANVMNSYLASQPSCPIFAPVRRSCRFLPKVARGYGSPVLD